MLSHVTFTGWDRHTDLDDLSAFLERCPQDRVEIAVLHSTSHVDEDRYPDVDKAVAILRAAKAAGQRSAVHLCGRIAKAFLNYSDALVAASPLIWLADRVQVNVDENFWPAGPEKYRRAYELARTIGRPVIVQTRDIDGWPDVEPVARAASRMVPFLFDRSAGTGATSTLWPEVPGNDLLVGYAGGLGPENVEALVSKIALTRPHARFWVDMETCIREFFLSGQRRPDEPPVSSFVSIAKCAAVMKAVQKYMERPC